MNRSLSLLAILVLSLQTVLAMADEPVPIYFGMGTYEFAEERRAFGKPALTNTMLRGQAARALKGQVPRAPDTLRLSSIFLRHKSPDYFHLTQTRVAHGISLLFSHQQSLLTAHVLSSLDIQILSNRGGVYKSVELPAAELALEEMSNGKSRLFISPAAVKRLKDFVESLREDGAVGLQLAVRGLRSEQPYILPLQYRDLNRKAYYLSPGEDCRSKLSVEEIERDLIQLDSDLGD